MKLQPLVQDPQKWIRFYKSTMNAKPLGRIQRGSGGTLGPRINGRGGFRTVKDMSPVVSPTEQVVQQIKSEVRRRRQEYKKGRPASNYIRSTRTTKRKGSKQSSKKRRH